MKSEETFWTDSRRRLIAKTLANLFLLLIGASATGEKVAVGGAIVVSGVLAVVIMPDKEGEAE